MAIDKGFVPIPTFSYINHTVYVNNLKVFSCPYALAIEGDRYFEYKKYNTFRDVNYLVPLLKDKLKIQLNLTNEEYHSMDFFNLYTYTDAIISQMFAGIP